MLWRPPLHEACSNGRLLPEAFSRNHICLTPVQRPTSIRNLFKGPTPAWSLFKDPPLLEAWSPAPLRCQHAQTGKRSPSIGYPERCLSGWRSGQHSRQLGPLNIEKKLRTYSLLGSKGILRSSNWPLSNMKVTQFDGSCTESSISAVQSEHRYQSGLIHLLQG